MLKKVSKFVKENFKLVIVLCIGFMLASTGVYAANTIYSKNVTYDNSKSGLSATNVQDALDETYNKCMPTAADKIINLYEDGSSINSVYIGNNSNNPEVKLNENKNIMLDNNGNYRYYGANPNNYVYFNEELWRIIGVFYDVDDGTGKKEKRLKLIRNESIGDCSWDSSASTVNSGQGVNDWSKSDLMTELNDLYYNSKSGTCYTGQNNATTICDFTDMGLNSSTKDMINSAVYYLGAGLGEYGGASTVFNLYANEFYELERDTAVYNCSLNDGACPRATTWVGNVGIMYPSDYMYATDLSLCIQTGSNYSVSDCEVNDWLFIDEPQWTISSTIRYPHLGFNIYYNFITDGRVYYTMSVRPVVYLKSNIVITDGFGTSSDPYILR